jgi:hypothetical protein
MPATRLAPSALITLHTEAADVSDAAPYWKDMASHCFVGYQATVEGFYPPEWPHELRYFRVVHIEPCDHDNARRGASQRTWRKRRAGYDGYAR